MIKGNISATVSIIRATPSPTNGVFAYGADDKLRFHINDPIADLPCSETLLVKMDESMFLGSNNNNNNDSEKKDWMAKMMNIAVILRAMEIFVIVDTYKGKSSAGDGGEGATDQSLDCYVRLDASAITSYTVSATPVMASSLPYVAQTLANVISNHHVAFSLPSSPLVLVVDLRCLTKKKQQQQQSSSTANTNTVKGSVTHKNSGWEKANSVQVFFEERLVHYFFVPVNPAGADGSRKVLETIKALKPDDFMDEFDIEGCTSPSPAAIMEPPSANNNNAAAGEGGAAAAGADPNASKKRKRNVNNTNNNNSQSADSSATPSA